ncbi:VOC family protein [Sphingomonas sp. PL-96]|uniref:VOC family protein n=1 Tax=Sphingomonas sp. PL-96 TaxID=2887201 RepID=UPI001E5C669B|nr:VOC family protein [Sphingomonas sp. PL-96]MCC2978005.1 VOC family protein [Sphingomonas sp. PL-96]
MTDDRPRGIEHVGITVPDHDAAIHFFKEAFGAEPLFSLTTRDGDPMRARELAPKNGLAQGTAIVAVTMLRLGNGANLEVFEIDHPTSRRSSGIADQGISHFSLTVDDIDATTARFVAAGGALLEGPYDLTGQEAGPGNRGRFGLTPWGLLIEFESLSSATTSDTGTDTQRWLPD